MDASTIASVAAAAAVAGSMFYWGGQLQALVRMHDRRLDHHDARLREGGL